MKTPAPMVKATRGGHLESLHRGHLAVARPDGALLDHLGDPDFPTFLRSAAKPFQVVPVVEEGLASKYGFTGEEIAVMCGSLSGQDFHVRAVSSILAKIGLDESFLDCGIHPPSHRPTAKALAAAGEKPRQIHNNCAGKHAAMLALCVHRGWSPKGYVSGSHPVQQLVKRFVAEMLGMKPDDLAQGLDGCGVLVFCAPLRAVARGYARLSWPEGDSAISQERAEAIKTITKACAAHPEMIAGDERICTDAMRAAGGKILAKTGSEGSYGISLLDAGMGVAFKIEDGSMRALPPAVVEVLVKCGSLTEEAANALEGYRRTHLKNHRGEMVGLIEPCLEWRGLERPDLRKSERS